MVEVLCSQIEQAKGLSRTVGLEALIETALGMANVETIAQSSRRLEALHFGVADYAASCRARTVVIGGLNPDYPGDQWHAALSRMTVACRAYGLRAIDGPFGDFNDPEGYLAGARRAAALGIEGKWAIHPSQVALANEVFSPPAAEVARAKGILAALQEAAVAGKGAAQLDGKMIDAASARMAENIVRLAEKNRRRRKVRLIRWIFTNIRQKKFYRALAFPCRAAGWHTVPNRRLIGRGKSAAIVGLSKRRYIPVPEEKSAVLLFVITTGKYGTPPKTC